MTFVKGQSGNPGGRAKKDRYVEELAKQYTEAAIEALVDALGGRDRVAAANALLAYGWGKPRQPMEHSGETSQRYVIHSPPPVENVDEWLQTYAPKDVKAA